MGSNILLASKHSKFAVFEVMHASLSSRMATYFPPPGWVVAVADVSQPYKAWPVCSLQVVH